MSVGKKWDWTRYDGALRDIQSQTGLDPAATTADGWLQYRIHDTPKDLAPLTPRVAQEALLRAHEPILRPKSWDRSVK